MQTFCSNAEWLKIHLLSSLTLQVSWRHVITNFGDGCEQHLAVKSDENTTTERYLWTYIYKLYHRRNMSTPQYAPPFHSNCGLIMVCKLHLNWSCLVFSCCVTCWVQRTALAFVTYPLSVEPFHQQQWLKCWILWHQINTALLSFTASSGCQQVCYTPLFYGLPHALQGQYFACSFSL